MANSAQPGERTSGFLRSIEIPQALRALVRAREAGLVALAALIGVIAGLVVALMGVTVALMHRTLYGIPLDERLSGQTHIETWAALAMPTLGGILFGFGLWVLVRVRPGREVDPIEANALHGGRMSFRGSMIVALQTIWSRASAPRSALKRVTRNLRAASRRGSDRRSGCGGATCACWSAAARPARSPAHSARRWPARSTHSSW
jgi:hypothetical protein